MTMIIDGTNGLTFNDATTQTKAGLVAGGTIATGTVTTLTTTTISDGTNSTSATNSIKGSAKAWVNFQGGNTNTAGVINSSYNVSSITVNGTGDYTVNYTNAFSSAYAYAVVASCSEPQIRINNAAAQTTTTTRIETKNTSNTNINSVIVSVIAISA